MLCTLLISGMIFLLVIFPFSINQFKEIIIGISPNQQGILTTNYLLNEINKNVPHIKVSQLSIGIPFGASIDYIDQLTMSYAIKNRKDIK